jgi:hypothetical protein
MERNYLAHRHGDANNAILAAVGLQPSAPHQVAEHFIVPHPGRDLCAAKIGRSMKNDSSHLGHLFGTRVCPSVNPAWATDSEANANAAHFPKTTVHPFPKTSFCTEKLRRDSALAMSITYDLLTLSWWD